MYKLTKTKKGAKFVYQVIDENGNVVSTRTSARNYVAATFNGAYYFGRLDLIGKGDHGRHVRMCREANKEPYAIAMLEE